MTRLPEQRGERIDRDSELTFTFDGKNVAAFEGDTIGSALFASGQRTFSRSFKYHRPRGAALRRRPVPQLPRPGGRRSGRASLRRALRAGMRSST